MKVNSNMGHIRNGYGIVGAFSLVTPSCEPHGSSHTARPWAKWKSQQQLQRAATRTVYNRLAE